MCGGSGARRTGLRTSVDATLVGCLGLVTLAFPPEGRVAGLLLLSDAELLPLCGVETALGLPLCGLVGWLLSSLLLPALVAGPPFTEDDAMTLFPRPVVVDAFGVGLLFLPLSLLDEELSFPLPFPCTDE